MTNSTPHPDEHERTSSTSVPLNSELEAFRESYVAMFGSVPPLPAAKFEVTGRLDPEAVRLGERVRAHAFMTDLLDSKTVQMLLFGMLLATGAGAARYHAIAAHRAGATLEELQAVVTLASAMASLGPANVGASILAELQDV